MLFLCDIFIKWLLKYVSDAFNGFDTFDGL